MKYREKNYRYIEAFQWLGTLEVLPKWFSDVIISKNAWFDDFILFVRGEKGTGLKVIREDYIVQMSDGSYQILNPKQFWANYQLLDERMSDETCN